jgi:flavin reductase (DIM6/NTAB) family NADH-FMN oxidoreductase RutF
MAEKCIEGAEGFSHHYPRLAAIVTCHAQGKDNAMALAWHAPLSFRPPLIGVSIALKRFTYEIILETGEFGINFLPLEKAKLIAAVGGSSGRGVDKLLMFGMEKEQPLKTSVPILKDAYAAYECKLVDHRTYGDHEWFVGQVVATHFLEEAFNAKGVLDLKQVAPALYLGAELYVSTDKDRVELLDRKVYGRGKFR